MSVLKTDIVVVGAGPTGLAAAWRLSTGGARVLCIEQGEHFPLPCLRPDDPGFVLLRQQHLNPNPLIRQASHDYPIDDDESDIAPMIGNAVNGGSNYWAAHIPRFRPDDFRVRSTNGVGEDWPFDYAELAPWYDLYEAQAGAAYRSGTPDLPPRPPPPRDLPPPYPGAQRLGHVFSERGWQWWPVDLARGPRGVTDDPCRHSGPCDIGCPSWRGALATAGFLPQALEHGLRLMTATRAVRITHDASGRIDGLICRRGKDQIRIEAETVVLAANGIATPWLMQVSTSGRHPHGIGNANDQLGRGLMLHPYAWTRGYIEGLGGRDAGPASSIICTQFRPAAPGSGAHRGIRLQSGDESRRPPPPGADAGTWVSISVCAEDLPEADNRIMLSGTLRTAEDLPAPKMRYRVSENSHRLLHFGVERASEALRAAGAREVEVDPLIHQAGFHIMGTARMGTDPATSVVDPWGQCHAAPGLVLADASVFVTGSAMNPTATAAALALRASDRILGRIGSHG